MPEKKPGLVDKVAGSVRHASTSVSTPSSAVPMARAWNVVPMIESLRHACPALRTPSSSSRAVRADVADPVGDRSTSPSAKIATLRTCSGPTSSWTTVP